MNAYDWALARVAAEWGQPDEDVELEDVEIDDTKDPALVREIATMLGLLPPAEREMMLASLGGASQDEIASARGITQPSVSLRLARIRRWLAECAPVRVEMRRRKLRTRREADALIAQALLLHEPIGEIARRVGIPSRTCSGWVAWLREANNWPDVVGRQRWVRSYTPTKTG